MSTERALRTMLERDAAAVTPDETTALRDVLQVHRSRQRARRMTYALAGTAVVAGALFAVPRALDAWQDDAAPVVPVEQPSPGPAEHFPLTGVYSTRIPNRPGAIRTYSLAGRWTLHVEASGSVRLGAPPDYVRTFGVPSEGVFRLDGNRLSTLVLHHRGLGCEEEGVYEWRVAARKLQLTAVADSCRLRAPVLTSIWTARR